MEFYESIQVPAHICNDTVPADLSVKKDVDIFWRCNWPSKPHVLLWQYKASRFVPQLNFHPSKRKDLMP